MTRDDILAVASNGRKPVPLVDSIDAFLRPLTANEKRETVEYQAQHGEGETYKFLYVRSLCDADGVRQLNDEDASLVGDFPVPMVEDVLEQVLKLNRMGPYQKKASSTTTPSSSSPSA